MQDSKGYMWFCTDAGVSRYVGYNFHNYSTENGLSDNTVFGCFEDKKGKIWFRTLSGKLSYFYKDSIYTIEANESIAKEIENGIISSIYVDADDTIWCGINLGKGYFKISPPYKISNFKYVKLNPNHYFLDVDESGYVWGSIIDKHPNPQIKLFIINEYDKKSFVKMNSGLPRLWQSVSCLRTSDGQITVIGDKEIFRLHSAEVFSDFKSSFISIYGDKNKNIWAGVYNKMDIFTH